MILLTLGSACEPTQENTERDLSEVVVVSTDARTNTPVPTALPTASATATATLPPLPTPTNVPTMTPSASCPELGTTPSFIYPKDPNELQTSILSFLNEGGRWEDLWESLDELKIKHDSIQVDMNGDGVIETAVYAQTYDDEDYITDHAWWIFQCTSNQYNILYDSRNIYAFHSHFMAEDLNNDNRPEIIAVSGFFGSACDLEPEVWSWQIDEIVNLSPNHLELELGCSIDQRVLFQDISGNDIKEMILIGETVSHLDYGPPRGITQTFTLENGGYQLVNTVFAPAELRVHVLDDAQRALDDGNLPLAVSHYTTAAYGDMETVQSYYFPIYEKNPYSDAYQQAFAFFRLAIIQRVIGNEEEASLLFTELNKLYIENQPGHEFVVLAQIFFDVYEEKEDLSKACEQVTKYIGENYENKLPKLTAHFYWGGNIAFYITPDSFCPVFNVSANNEP